MSLAGTDRVCAVAQVLRKQTPQTILLECCCPGSVKENTPDHIT